MRNVIKLGGTIAHGIYVLAFLRPAILANIISLEVGRNVLCDDSRSRGESISFGELEQRGKQTL